MADDLETRLQGHAKAFDGLMSLIPAKFYYGEDNDDQWQRKKQTKEEKCAAKRAKLNPEAYKSALDVHKDMERKRKRELSEGNEGSDNDILLEQPKEGLVESRKSLKKQKPNDPLNEESKKTKHGEPDLADGAARQAAKAERRREKRAQKQAKKSRKLAKAEAKKLRKQEETTVVPEAAEIYQTLTQEDYVDDDDENKDDDPMFSDQLDHVEFQDIGEADIHHSPSSRSLSPVIGTDTFFNSNGPSSASSTSSINPPSEPETTKLSTAAVPADAALTYPTANLNPSSLSLITPNVLLAQTNIKTGSEVEKTKSEGSETRSPGLVRQTYQKAPKMSPINQELLKERLEARIAALRAERKADGLDGKPARNRGELIEARRRKEEARRAHKKELRNKSKEQDAEAEAARLRGGSGSPLWNSPGVFGPPKENNFAFGRVSFNDGTQLDTALNGTIDLLKKKGPQDPKTALDAAQRKHSRLSGLDAEKRADIEEKDRWLNAKKRAQGEKVKDDTSLLKKALKRKQKGKDQSEKAWKEREDGVQKGINARQAKREGNLAKRRDEKGAKKNGTKKPVGPSKPKKRPGFEGSFKTGARRMM